MKSYRQGQISVHNTSYSSVDILFSTKLCIKAQTPSSKSKNKFLVCLNIYKGVPTGQWSMVVLRILEIPRGPKFFFIYCLRSNLFWYNYL